MPRVFRRTWRSGGKLRTSPWYSLEYRGVDGRLVRHQTDPPTSSAKVAREQLVQALAQAGSRTERVSVQRILDAYGTYLQTHSPSHHRRLARYVLAAWGEAFGHLPAHAFRLEDVDRFTGELRERKLSDSTLASYLGILRAAFRRAVRDELVAAGHPVVSLRIPYSAAERHVIWSDEEIEEVASRLPPWARSLLLVLRTTGLRVGDACTLRWDAVQGGVLKIRQEKTDELLEMPLSSAARAVLEGIPREPDVPWVFWTRSRADRSVLVPRKVTVFRDTLTEAMDAAGVKGRTIHDLRRTFATRTWNAGASAGIVAALLGQSGTRLVSRYTHAEMETLRKATELGCVLGCGIRTTRPDQAESSTTSATKDEPGGGSGPEAQTTDPEPFSTDS